MKYLLIEQLSKWRFVMDNFQVVGKSKRRRGRKPKDSKLFIERRTICNDNVGSKEFLSIGSLTDKIEKCRIELQQSQLFADVKGLFNDDVKSKHVGVQPLNKRGFKDIVCYGIGKIHSCPTARYQFALLLLLHDYLKITGRCYVFEPCFSQLDKDIVVHFGCNLIPENEEGKRTVKEKTLFFMLHCGKPLYNNLLWSNWDPCNLDNLYILGNSFSSYLERFPLRRLREEAMYIASILPNVVEVPFPNTFVHQDIFNDSSFHYFPRTSLKDIPDVTWRHCPEPLYDESEPEIVQNPHT